MHNSETPQLLTPDGSNMTHNDPGWLTMARDEIPGVLGFEKMSTADCVALIFYCSVLIYHIVWCWKSNLYCYNPALYTYYSIVRFTKVSYSVQPNQISPFTFLELWSWFSDLSFKAMSLSTIMTIMKLVDDDSIMIMQLCECQKYFTTQNFSWR